MMRDVLHYLAFVASLYMVGLGLRMLTQFILSPGSIYPSPLPGDFDFWFDWFPLAMLGFALLFCSLHRIIKGYSRSID